jgi:hypothetical protein
LQDGETPALSSTLRNFEKADHIVKIYIMIFVTASITGLPEVVETHVWAQTAHEARTRDGSKPTEMASAVEDLLWYLPLDTQTVMVAQNSFRIEEHNSAKGMMSRSKYYNS